MSRYVKISTVSISPIYRYETDLPGGITMTEHVISLLERELAPGGKGKIRR